MESNHQVTGSKPVALPFGYTPMQPVIYGDGMTGFSTLDVERKLSLAAFRNRTGTKTSGDTMAALNRAACPTGE